MQIHNIVMLAKEMPFKSRPAALIRMPLIVASVMDPLFNRGIGLWRLIVLKKMNVEHLQIGMKVTSFCDSWMDHPFWKSSFIIEDQKILLKLQASGIKQVMVDLSASKLSAQTIEFIKSLALPQVEASNAHPEQSASSIAQDIPHTRAKPSKPATVSYHEEIARAERICAKSGAVMRQMFNEARMGQALNTEIAKTVSEEITNSVMRNQGALISVVRLKTKDDYTYMHSVAVCALMVALGQQLGLPEDQVRLAGLAGLMHDIGKIGVPLDVLNKPGALTQDEFKVVRNHPTEGYHILKTLEDLHPSVLDVCLHHHERIDGKGYPEGLKGDEISLLSKMGAVCDVYDAITSNRPYKKGWEPGDSIKRMAEWAGAHLDAAVFQAFVKSIGIYPVGSLVKLSSDRMAIVIEQNQKSLLAPLVKIFYSIKGQHHIAPELKDLSIFNEKIVSIEKPETWGFKDLSHLTHGA